MPPRTLWRISPIVAIAGGLLTWVVTFLAFHFIGYEFYHEIHHPGLIIGIYVSPMVGILAGVLIFKRFR